MVLPLRADYDLLLHTYLNGFSKHLKISVLDITIDVVPVTNDLNKNIDVVWVLNKNASSTITTYNVYWCQKTLDGECEVSTCITFCSLV